MFEKITGLVKNYNEKAIQAGEPYATMGLISIEKKSSPEEISQLERAAGIRLPEALKLLYTGFGALQCDSMNENNSIHVFSPASLLAKLEDEDDWSRTPSLGLIDMIKLSWGNDRYEFEEELNNKIREAVNTNYFCFGWYYTDDNQESAHYLYFDREEKFGYVFYHQDEFSELVSDFLKPMSAGSIATQTLEELLCESLQRITNLESADD
ncbi:SMI1/KNR4 family protein [Dyadobacter aurulentus]|uniref:SMI1/KNR4 family protein n=1 Tax=Dyadobacter sp. UC 10 TaxID=2605428 RepID=UPI0011F15A3C|nr:SMI1/KNR4 family protein [Dyadobacter sp. UC 10]KAA0992963.1 SMI1/KNR4 family protein [Dyadobacter sp. UC 10]